MLFAYIKISEAYIVSRERFSTYILYFLKKEIKNIMTDFSMYAQLLAEIKANQRRTLFELQSDPNLGAVIAFTLLLRNMTLTSIGAISFRSGNGIRTEELWQSGTIDISPAASSERTSVMHLQHLIPTKSLGVNLENEFWTFFFQHQRNAVDRLLSSIHAAQQKH